MGGLLASELPTAGKIIRCQAERRPGSSHRGFVVEVPVGASPLANAASGARIRLQAERRPAIFPQPLRNQLCAVSLAPSGVAFNKHQHAVSIPRKPDNPRTSRNRDWVSPKPMNATTTITPDKANACP